jgi:ATP-dependent helicase/nuclease subunit A
VTRPADWKEREKGRDPDHSWIVQAPAGSGKTELLTQRMLGLLAGVENPEEVIAITFTRKAAAEMSHRLVKRLQAAAGQPEAELEPHEQVSRDLALAVLRNDSERGWNLLDQPSRLRIRTIDSLCSELARQLPILSGLGGGHQVTQDAEPLYRLAAARTMASIEDDGDELQADVVQVLTRYDNQYDRLVNLLTSMLGHREQWIGHLLSIKTGDGFDRHALEEALSILIKAELKAVSALMPAHLATELPVYLSYAARHLSDEASLSIRALLKASDGQQPARLNLTSNPDSLSHWVAMIGFLLTGAGAWRKRITKAEGFPALEKTKGEERENRLRMKEGFTELLDSLRDNDELLDRFNVVRKLPGPDYDDESWESLESLMRILIRAFQEWHVVMSETGETDFSEVAARALQALGEEDQPSHLALRMDYRIEHLLVDEFQDTSLSQIRLLDRLTAGWSENDGRTLFLVGDPMQSIYRFRKAEVSLFIEAFEGRLFRHINLQPLHLSVNFRSNVPIVDWVNKTFPEVMPAASDPLQDAVHYSESCPAPNAQTDGVIAVRISPQHDEQEEARDVAELIRQAGQAGTTAVLVRSRKHASAILSRLDQLKSSDPRFRYQAIDFNPLAETPVIQDLASLTLALTQLADRLAWLSVLRAPYVGLDLSDLDVLASGDQKRILLDVLDESLQPGTRFNATLTVQGLERLNRAAPILREAVQNRGRNSTRSLLEHSWTLLGGPACVDNASELDDAATFFNLLDSLENENLPIDRDTLRLRLGKLYAEPDAAADGKLQVMTIYAAKGLQFDTVILPGLNRKTGNDKGKLLHWFELAGQEKIVMSPMRNAQEKERQNKEGDLIQFISDVDKRRQRLENGRLLYVASTRAVHSLILFGSIEPKTNGEISPQDGTLLSELWPAVRQQQLPGLEAAINDMTDQEDIPETEAPCEHAQEPAPDQYYRRLPSDWLAPEPPTPVEQLSGQQLDVHDYIEFRWAGEDARLTGNLVHRLLQLIGEQGFDHWSNGGGMSKRMTWCYQQLASEGVKGSKADRIVNLTARAIENCLSSEKGQWILQAREEADCEYALTAILDGQVRSMLLDRSFVEAGERWIIDYKTSTHAGGDLEGFLQNESERYSGQLRRYRTAVALTEERPIRIALYFPLLDRFVEL